MKPLWLYLHFPDQYLHSLDHQGRQPLAVIDANRQIVQANACACSAGIQPGMSLATALSLSPPLQTRAFSVDRQQQLLQQKALWAGQFSANIYLDPPDGLWLEIASMLQLFGGEATLWRAINTARPEHWPLHMASASIPEQARLLARAALGNPEDNTAQRQQKLARLNLAALDIREADQLQLQRFGIQDWQHLQRLPLAELARRCSLDLIQQIRRIQGSQTPAMVLFTPPSRFEQNANLIEDVEQVSGLLFPLRPLVAALCGYLQQRQQSTRRIHLYLRHRHNPPTHWQLGLARAEHGYGELMTLLRYRLEKQHLPAPVTDLTLVVEQPQPHCPDQTSLLPQNGSSTAPPGGLLNHLQTRLDQQQLYRLHINADPRPHKASQWRPAEFGDPAQTSVRRPQRPLWLSSKPVPCHPPSIRLSAPERIGSGWWDGDDELRDYFISHQRQQYLWVYRTPQHQWFIQGYFG